MRATYLNIFVLLLTLTIGTANSSEVKPNVSSIAQLPIKNISNPVKYQFTGGQPTQEELSSLARLGIKHIINLRPKSEQTWNEPLYVKLQGMKYHSLPVAGISDININNANQLDSMLDKYSNEGVYVHCASGNRVGALIALHQGSITRNIDIAIEKGKRWGLTRLEPVVRDKLMQNSH